MSCVTNIILHLSVLDEDKIDHVNEFFAPGLGLVDADGHTLPDGRRWYGGDKNLEARIYVGAFNYLDLLGLIERITAIGFRCQEDVQLMVKEEADDRFRIITFVPDRRRIPFTESYGTPYDGEILATKLPYELPTMPPVFCPVCNRQLTIIHHPPYTYAAPCVCGKEKAGRDGSRPAGTD